MPSDRLLAKILLRNKVEKDDPPPPVSPKNSPCPDVKIKRSSDSTKSPTAAHSPVSKKQKLTGSSTNLPPTNKDTSKKPPQNETPPSSKSIIVEISPSARWTSGTSAPTESLSIFNLPADADAYKNVKTNDLLDRTRRRFGRFASDFVHALDAFEKLDDENNSQKASKEIKLLKESRHNLQQQINQSKEKITELMNNRKSWEADRVKLNSDNKWLTQDKTKLQNEVNDLKIKLTTADMEVKQLHEQMSLLENELKKVQDTLAETEEESISLLEEGYNICLNKFKEAGISIEGKTYQDYLKEMEEARKTTSTNDQTNNPATTSPQGEIHTAVPINTDNPDVDNLKAGDAP